MSDVAQTLVQRARLLDQHRVSAGVYECFKDDCLSSLIYCNNTFLELAGRPFQELQGDRFKFFRHQLYDESIYNQPALHADKGTPVSGYCLWQRKDEEVKVKFFGLTFLLHGRLLLLGIEFNLSSQSRLPYETATENIDYGQ